MPWPARLVVWSTTYRFAGTLDFLAEVGLFATFLHVQALWNWQQAQGPGAA
jgi:hypothetical protein